MCSYIIFSYPFSCFRDVLFGSIYEQFRHDIIAKGVYLQCLEPYILNDRLTSVTPEVMKDFIEHYRQKELISNVEACIVHMDIASLDIHQVSWREACHIAIMALKVYNQNSIFPWAERTLKIIITLNCCCRSIYGFWFFSNCVRMMEMMLQISLLSIDRSTMKQPLGIYLKYEYRNRTTIQEESFIITKWLIYSSE